MSSEIKNPFKLGDGCQLSSRYSSFNNANSLISGKEALIALANGEEVELQINGDMNWHDSTQWTVGELLCFKGRFRLKPRTIALNGFEVPAPFEPNEFEDCYMLSDLYEHGYTKTSWKYSKSIPAWRTEEEVKQVVEALRTVFKGGEND